LPISLNYKWKERSRMYQKYCPGRHLEGLPEGAKMYRNDEPTVLQSRKNASEIKDSLSLQKRNSKCWVSSKTLCYLTAVRLRHVIKATVAPPRE
jgi:hypothetical protein